MKKNILLIGRLISALVLGVTLIAYANEAKNPNCTDHFYGPNGSGYVTYGPHLLVCESPDTNDYDCLTDPWATTITVLYYDDMGFFYDKDWIYVAQCHQDNC